MPFARSTVAELIDRVRGDLRGRLEIAGSLLRRPMADVLGAVWGGTVHELYGFLEWGAKQLFGKTADRAKLIELAAELGITLVPATYAAGNVTAAGTDGSVIPIDTILRLDSVTAYRVTTGQVIAAGIATLPVVALLAGEAANLAATVSLSFESPIAGVNSIATVAAGGIAGGNEEEGTEALRSRYLLRRREPPMGGGDHDYEAWALEVAGVTRAWEYEHELGLGTVVVRFVRDLDASIFPDGGEVASVQTKLAAERPITAAVTAQAPVELPVAFTIHVVPDNAATRAAVEAEITDLMVRVAEPGNNAGQGTVLLSQIRTAIGIAAGVTDYALTAPAADVVPGVGELATRGPITWV